MRDRRVVGVGLGLLVALLWFALWAPTPDSGPSHVERAVPVDPPVRGERPVSRVHRMTTDDEATDAPPTGEEDPTATAWGGLRVRVVDDEGRPEPGGWARGEGCALSPDHDAAADGWLLYRAPVGACTLVGVRNDGVLRVEGAPVHARVTEGSVAEVTLVLPSQSMGAVNVAVGRLDGALRVRWAEDPGLDGLEEGDEIVAVDGVPVDELDGREVLQMLQGPVGTSVEVELARDDDTGLQTVTLQRRFVDPG